MPKFMVAHNISLSDVTNMSPEDTGKLQRAIERYDEQRSLNAANKQMEGHGTETAAGLKR